MKTYIEVCPEIEVPEVDTDSMFLQFSAIMKFNISVTDGRGKAFEKVFWFNGRGMNLFDSLKDCFQQMLDKKYYNIEGRVYDYHIYGDWKNLPIKFKLDHLPKEIRSTIESLFFNREKEVAGLLAT
jgi:hypothetical protein